MRKSAPIKVIVHHPTTEVGKRELAGRVADVHAEFVIHTISKLDCPLKQKLELLQVVIDTTKKKNSGQRLWEHQRRRCAVNLAHPGFPRCFLGKSIF